MCTQKEGDSIADELHDDSTAQSPFKGNAKHAGRVGSELKNSPTQMSFCRNGAAKPEHQLRIQLPGKQQQHRCVEMPQQEAALYFGPINTGVSTLTGRKSSFMSLTT